MLLSRLPPGIRRRIWYYVLKSPTGDIILTRINRKTKAHLIRTATYRVQQEAE
jgi:hypothetical protein